MLFFFDNMKQHEWNEQEGAWEKTDNSRDQTTYRPVLLSIPVVRVCVFVFVNFLILVINTKEISEALTYY